MNKICLSWLGMFVSLLVFATASNIRADETASFRIIPIPKEENTYSYFESTVITSQSELDTLMQTVSKAKERDFGRNILGNFEKALATAKLDFDRESLVLLRHTEGSISVPINFRQPRLIEKRILFQIDRQVPEPEWGLLGMMAYYCVALAINKTDVTQVEMQISGRQSIILSLGKEKTSNKPDTGDGK